MPRTESNARPANRDVRQARATERQAMSLFKRRLKKLETTDLTSGEKEKRSEALKKDYMNTIKPLRAIIQKDEKRTLDRKVGLALSNMGYSQGRSTNSDNRKKPVAKPNSASTPGKGSDEPITKKNKGGLIRTGNNDMRKGGLFR